jgi:hypothetical protein
MECFRDGINTNTHKAMLAFQDMVFIPAVVKICRFNGLTGTGRAHIYAHECACMREYTQCIKQS